MKYLKLSSFVLTHVLAVHVAFAAAPETNAITASQPPLSKTVGIHVVTRTVNPDKSITLLYRWDDSKLGHPVERAVVLNENTVIGMQGQLKKLSDVTDEAVRAPSVSTVGLDNTNVVLLRIGRQMIHITQDQLTPKQIAALEAVAPKPTPASEAALDKRVADMVSDLKLSDAPREERLRAVLKTDLRAVRDAHNAGFAPASSVRQNLNAGLNADLKPEQVESVKDVLTHGQLKHTFDTYHLIVPELTAEDDKFILEKLKQARESALDVKNSDELGPVFEPYKTQIEKYITAHGHDWHTAYKAFVSAQRPAATN